MKAVARRVCGILCLAGCALAAPGFFPHGQPVQAQGPPWESLADAYTKKIRPLLLNYCKRCHGAKLQEAELDLEGFAGFADVRKAYRVWQKVLEMLDTDQMPPKTARQPAEDERTRLKSWVRDYLQAEARTRAGDPGRVLLRRLSNAEYTYTIRDLTGVDSLRPAREFPVDGAAGEGFTNTGDALGMSPALLTKYLDAAKSIAGHAVLLPDGLRFSPHSTRRDWTNEVLDEIRTLYGKYSDSADSTKVNIQGLIFDAKQGGRLPVEKYLAATLAERDALTTGRKSVMAVAKERGLSGKYLGLIWQRLNERESSMLVDDVRARWRAAKPADAPALAAEISKWQKALWTFNSVGHIGKLGGPKAWMEPVTPLLATQTIRFKVPVTAGDEAALYLVATDAGDGNDHDFVVWQQPRFVAPGRPDLLLKDVREASRDLSALRADVFAEAAKYLQAADAAGAHGSADLAALAKNHALDATRLGVWLDFLGIGGSGPVKVAGHFTSKITSSAGYSFIQGWGVPQTPNLVANSSDQHVRIPGNMKPHGVAVHPAPKLNAVVGWQSPIAGKIRVTAKVAHAHPECGDGVAWSLEFCRGTARQPLAAGVAQGVKEPKIDPVEIDVQEGDLVALAIGPRANHSCDLTAVDLTLTSGAKTWDLAKDVSSDVLAGNPHADRLGNKAVWHFYTEPTRGANEVRFVIPKGSLLGRWRSAASNEEKTRLATEVQRLLTSGPTAGMDPADAALYRQLASLSGPLLGRLWELGERARTRQRTEALNSKNNMGLDPALFGVHPRGKGMVDAASLCVQAPSVVEVRVPADLVAGYELVTVGALHAESQDQGSVQLQVLSSKPTALPALQPGLPILVADSGTSRKRFVAAFDSFRDLFPPAVSYTRVVPVDEGVTLTLFYREDHHLARLMLDDSEHRRLDRLWDELDYVSHVALDQVDAFAQLMEFATQDGDPKLFEPLRKPILDRAAAFRKKLLDTQPRHLEAVLEFAGRAYRRPLAPKEREDLTGLYDKLRKQGDPHEEAVRLTIARVLVAPAFLYHLEKPGPGAEPTPVSDWELASRLSYFLWSSAPDAELREVAANGKLRDNLVAQMRRMLRDGRARRLATEFACQWLHIRGFDESSEKSERHFPTFAGLRGAMYEESILFFTDLFAQDRSILDILDADYTFLNDALANHYGIPGVTGRQWRRVEGVKKYGRGGIIGQATTLATQSGASRTSPILRGNWVSEVLLGEKLPRPPKGVPQLPDDETKTEGLTVRQLIEKHTSDPKCAVCHRRIDAYGFALEGFDAIGRRRDKDLADRPIDTHARTMDGTEFAGLEGLRDYLLAKRRDAFVRQFCRKLLGYALGRGVQLADEPLLDEIHEQLRANDYKISVALAAIVRSRQFREIRGRDFKTEQ